MILDSNSGVASIGDGLERSLVNCTLRRHAKGR